MEIDSALNTVQTLKSELQDAKMAAVDGQLKPLPGETVISDKAEAWSALHVGNVSHDLCTKIQHSEVVLVK